MMRLNCGREQGQVEPGGGEDNCRSVSQSVSQSVSEWGIR